MQTEFKVIDIGSKSVIWKRVDALMVKALRSLLIITAVFMAAGLLLKAGLWLAGL